MTGIAFCARAASGQAIIAAPQQSGELAPDHSRDSASISRRARDVAEGEQQARDLGVVFGGRRACGRRSSRTVRRRGRRAAIRIRRAGPRRTPARCASANEPRIRSASRVPRCQERNSSRLRRMSPGVSVAFRSGGWHGPSDIAMLGRNVSPASSATHISSDASRHSRQAVRAGDGAARHRGDAREADRARRRPRCRRSAVASADRDRSTAPPRRRSAQLNPRDWPGRDRHGQGAGRGASSRASAAARRGSCAATTPARWCWSISMPGATSSRACCRSAPSASSAARSSFTAARRRSCIRTGSRRPTARTTIRGDRAGLSADRRPVVARSGKGRCRGVRARARPCPNGSIRRSGSGGAGRVGARRWPPRMRRKAPPISIPRPRRASGSPMTKSCRASSPSRWCGRGAAGARAGCSPAPGNCRRAPRPGSASR